MIYLHQFKHNIYQFKQTYLLQLHTHSSEIGNICAAKLFLNQLQIIWSEVWKWCIYCRDGITLQTNQTF